MLHLNLESAVPHISLVFRGMWDTTAANLRSLAPLTEPVQIRGIPHLAKNERDMGHPTLRRQEIFKGGYLAITTGTRGATVRPSWKIVTIDRVLVMSSRGLAASTIRSACLPGRSVPLVASMPSKAALFWVAQTMACIGVSPACTMSSSSRCSENPGIRVA